MKSCERTYLPHVVVKIMPAEVNCQECAADCTCNIIKKSIIYIDRLSRNINPWDGSHGHEKSKESNLLKKNLTNRFAEGPSL